MFSSALNISVQQSRLRHSYTVDDFKRVLQAHQLDLDYYQHDKLYAEIYQIADPSNSHRDIDEPKWSAFVEAFCNYCSDFARGLAKVHFKSVINLEGVIYATAVDPVDGLKALKEAIASLCTVAASY